MLASRARAHLRACNNDDQGEDAMKLPRRKFLHLAAGAAALPAVSRIARAQTYPSRPIRVIVPFAEAHDLRKEDARMATGCGSIVAQAMTSLAASR
jgi:hypothetical protein